MSIYKKYLLPFLIAFISFFNIQAQTVHPHYEDGYLFVNLADEFEWTEAQKQRNISLENLPLFNTEEIRSYGIVAAERPFVTTTSLELRNTLKLKFSALDKTNELLELLHAKTQVDFAEQVPLNKKSYTPNDLGPNSGFLNAWHLYQIDAETAWNYSLGNTEIIVAIVDDAVETSHNDLSANLWVNAGEIPGDGVDNDANGYIDDVNGFDVASNDGDPNPPNSTYDHGTHVAGISSAATDNGQGIAAIGFSVRLMAVKASGSNPQFVSSGYSGITYAADNGAKIINCSWGGFGSSNTARNVVNYAYSKGALVVAAAGNDDVSSPQYPGAYANAISVASTTTGDNRSSFTNYGSWVNISAPGSNIWSTDVNNGYRSASGTSMASPLVAGLCGLMLSLDPDMNIQDLRDCLTNSADNIDAQNPNYIGQLGAGRINAGEALKCVNARISAPPTPRILSSESQICPGDTVEYRGISTAGLITTYSWFFPGGTPQNSTDANPKVVYNTAGKHDVQLTLGNQFGTNTLVENEWVKIDANSRATYFKEDFEGNFLQNGWQIENPDNANSWVAIPVNGTQDGSKAIVMSLFNYSNVGQRDRLISPAFDLSGVSSYDLKFDHAYKRRNAGATDSLIIKVSTNNGQSFDHVLARFGESGNGTWQTGAISNSQFLPVSAGDWCFGDANSNCTVLDMSAYAGEPFVKIMFETVSANGNNLFLDNVEIVGSCEGLDSQGNPSGISSTDQKSITLYPNPTSDLITVDGENIQSISILDLTGKQVHAHTNNGGQNSINLSLGTLPSGLYITQIQQLNGNLVSKRLIVR